MKTNRIIRALWGDLQGEELTKFVLLALGMFFVIGSYWPIKILKESIFINMVGPLYLPRVKMVSLLFFFPLVLIYSKIIDFVTRERAIYFMVTLFCSLGVMFVYLLAHPTIGVSNPQTGPHRLLAWFFYIFAECYVSLMVALFWSFINDITTPESAQKGYGMIIFGTQSGGLLSMILSNFLVAQLSYVTIIPLIVAISMGTLFMSGVIVFILVHVMGKKILEGYKLAKVVPKKEGAKGVGFFDGLRVLLTRPYVLGIFGLVFFYELITTVMQFQMLFLVKSTYVEPDLVNKFLFKFGFVVQSIACFFGLFGTSYFQRTFGIRFCLVVYPLLLGCFISVYMFFPTLFLISAVVVVAKAINYVFNLPAKEILYIPTSKSIKYKAKAWIDMFGMRFAKGGGSVINDTVGPLVGLTCIVSLMVIGVWAFLADSLGKMFKSVTDKNQTID